MPSYLAIFVVVVFLGEMGFCYVAQAALELLESSNLLPWPLGVLGFIGVSHRTKPQYLNTLMFIVETFLPFLLTYMKNLEATGFTLNYFASLYIIQSRLIL